jgi:putative ABC transport system permease protein
MFWRILRESFFRERKRKALAVATVLLVAMPVTALVNVCVDVGDKMVREMTSYGSNIRLVPKSETLSLKIAGRDYNPLEGRAYLDQGDLHGIKSIFWRHNVVAFAPFLETRVELENAGTEAVPLVGTYFERNVPVQDNPDFRTGVRRANPYWTVRGEWPEDGSREVVVGADLAEELGVKPGDIIRAEGRAHNSSSAGTVADAGSGRRREPLTVTGILTTGGEEDGAIVGSLGLVQEVVGMEDRVASVSVNALTVPEDELSRRARRDRSALTAEEYDRWYCTAYVSTVAHQLEEAVPNAAARPVWQVAATQGAVVRRVQYLMAVVTVAALIAGALGISSLMNTTIMERSREIGLMKALGAENASVALHFLSEILLICLAGVAGGLAGGFVLDGVDTSALSQQERTRVRRDKIGLVFQQFHLVPYLSALENVLLAQYYHSTVDEDQAAEALQRVGLGARTDHLPSQLSGGEQQRVCLARALINEPAIILADEPTGNLDEENERSVLGILRDLHAEGRTIVLVTHNPELGNCAERMIYLHHGRVVDHAVSDTPVGSMT